jgi:membrane fusion protein (multidrug efflux system)
MVPSEAVIPELNSHKLFTYKGGKVSQKTVDIGLRTESEVQITDGINSGDTVITTGILQVQEGMSVSLSAIN